jgi:site-specific recombinase XerD
MDGDIDTHIASIRTHNKPILSNFQQSLFKDGLSPKTIRNHVQNMEFFAEYLVYYEPLRTLTQAKNTDIVSFLDDWFLRKAMWSSVEAVKSYLATFKKFFVWMKETNQMAPRDVDDVLTTIKEDREDLIDAAKVYFGSIYGD